MLLLGPPSHLDPGAVLHRRIVEVDFEPVPDRDGGLRKSQHVQHGDLHDVDECRGPHIAADHRCFHYVKKSRDSLTVFPRLPYISQISHLGGTPWPPLTPPHPHPIAPPATTS